MGAETKKSPRLTTSRARGAHRKPLAVPTNERIRTIVDLMVSLRWSNAEAASLATTWGCSVSRVRNLASEAHRQVVAAFDPPEETRNRFLRTLDFIAADALNAKRCLVSKNGKKYLVPAPNHDAATRAVLGAAELLGIKRTTLEHTGRDGGPITITDADSSWRRLLDKLASLAARGDPGRTPAEPDGD
jgi:hypothetical protein